MNPTIDNPTTLGGSECPIELETSKWSEFDKPHYVCRAAFFAEPEGGFSVHATRLPGVVSEGETIEEATANILEAFKLAIQYYLESGAGIPWEPVSFDQQPFALRNLTIDPEH